MVETVAETVADRVVVGMAEATVHEQKRTPFHSILMTLIMKANR